MTPLRRTFATVLTGTSLLAAASAQEQAPWFEEVGSAVGLEWTHVSGAKAHPTPNVYWFPEVMGGGTGVFDFDGDGDLDVYLVQSGYLDPASGMEPVGNRLFRNQLAETGSLSFVDVTEETGVGDTGYGMGCSCADYDQDGDVDLYVTNVGANVLYQNQGNGKFKNVTAAMKLGDGRWGTSSAWFDADLDGDLDLYLVNNLNWSPQVETPCINYRNQPDYCSPNNYNAHSVDAIYLQGRLGFLDRARQLGLHATAGNGLGVAVADYDRDGLQDVYVANDATPNALWHNLGGRDGFKTQGFEDVALRNGCAVNSMGTPEAGMGVQWVDINQDGWLDLFMTHLRRETNTFYLNNGKGRFRDQSRMAGLGAPSTNFTGFGMAFHDYDQDGQLDLYVANGAVQAWGEDESFDPADPYAEPNHLYRGLGGSKFEFLGEGTASPVIGSSRGAAFGDLDNDGDVDVVIVDRDARAKVLRNIAPKKGNWIGFDIQNAKGATALGSLVRLETRTGEGDATETKVQWRLVSPYYSYLASNDPRIVFGVPEGHTVAKVEVMYSGSEELKEYPGLAAGQYHTLR